MGRIGKTSIARSRSKPAERQITWSPLVRLFSNGNQFNRLARLDCVN